MALSFFKGAGRRRDPVISIDLGRSMTKAVQLQRKGARYVLSRYGTMAVPSSEREMSGEMVAKHVKEIHALLETNVTAVSLALGVNDSVVRSAELQAMPISDMRQILTNNTRHYLQQDFPEHVFDCFILPPGNAPKPNAQLKEQVVNPKQKVLVVGAKNRVIEDIQAAIGGTGLHVDQIMPGGLGPVNALALAMPEVFSREVLALVDIGFKSTSISIVSDGEWIMSRAFSFGGDRLTNGLAETLGISHDEAEGMKVTMLAEEQTSFEASTAPWARELRASLESLARELVASIDFFEHERDRPVSQVLMSGRSAQSEILIQALQVKLNAKCKTWWPLSGLGLELPARQAAAIEAVAPQLAGAVGAGAAAL